MQFKDTQDKTSTFIDQCRRHQLKVTPQRLSIYNTLVHLNNHPTTDSIYRIISKTHPRISFDTVNRTLLTFSNIGVIDVVESLGNQRRFDPNTQPHHHFQCIGCNNIFDLNHEPFNHLHFPVEYKDQYTVSKYRIVFQGKCRKCETENNKI